LCGCFAARSASLRHFSYAPQIYINLCKFELSQYMLETYKRRVRTQRERASKNRNLHKHIPCILFLLLSLLCTTQHCWLSYFFEKEKKGKWSYLSMQNCLRTQVEFADSFKNENWKREFSRIKVFKCLKIFHTLLKMNSLCSFVNGFLTLTLTFSAL